MASLYPYLILVGVSIIVASFWLLTQARRRVRITNELVALNERLEFDLPDFLRNCWQPLAAAGFRGLSWHLDWFGSTLSATEGEEGELFISRKLEVDDICLTVNLYDSRRRFEQRYFSTMVSDSLFLLLYTDMWVKLGTVQGAFAQSAKMNVFLQHDMKNIVQLVNLLAEQLAADKPGAEDRLLESLRVVMPTLRKRCERFLTTLSSEPQVEVVAGVDLNEVMKATAEIHDLRVSITGQAEVAVNEQTLHSILDNLFGNYVDQMRRDPAYAPDIAVTVEDESEHKVSVRITDNHGKPCLWPERLFEPFWSEKGDGLGIGLYHCRQLLNSAGGSIEARAPADKPLIFVMNLPKNV